MLELLFFITAGLWITYTAKVDSEHLLKNEYITNHASRLITRVLTGGLVAFSSPIGGLVLGLLFWALFDTILNRYRGKDWFYVGSVANTDKFFKDKYSILLVTKGISLILSIVLLAIYGL